DLFPYSRRLAFARASARIGEPFFVMDLIEGRSLRDVMRREHLETGRIACIIQQTSYAITYAHELGVIHRDLKPDNIMLRDSDDSVVVIDFGIATVQEWKREQRRGDSPKKTLLVGTAEYMAPEQIRGLPEVASDIWALDVISFELLTGQLPFAVPRDEKTGQVQWQQLSALHLAGVRVKPADLRPYLPDAAQSALLKSLAFAPAERHAQARDFGDALFAALTTAPQPASAPTEIISYSTIAATEELPSPQAANQVAAPTHPAQSWASLRDYARHTPRIQPELANANDAQRGMGARPGSPPNRFRQGDQLRLVIDSDWEGHLFLLDEGPEGIIYCLCPSHFAPDTRLRRERCVLPQAGARYDAFELGGGQPGREHLLAIVSDEPLGLDWLPRDAQEPARVLNQANIEMLLARLRALDAACWMAFATHFEIVA
ncbi:MAG TPA: protein kinase, partial [Blastocatellia bacterium]|nr:protein kinase [Blastocatellia bacterium]